ncbi:peptidase inhibitor family I36 protein [Streptomyces purpureus]|uniref:Peptidase inhibitor family I36 n=1 Tax=Streptomyces purpureus TaxID=1951 RepID=A0A918H393_9ACTN|nr:peptidase inhibitor family I36 protein [Streptomyces purpureus]GGT30897.1 hypothetical protein GCM10014713_25370 [Streptomyces purpureus]
MTQQRTFRGIARLVTALAGIFVVLVGGLATAGAAGAASTPGFQAQARNAGLSAGQAEGLQAQVDAYKERTGGVQTAPNKIAFPGGELTVVVPGEKYARDLSDPVGTLAACQHLRFCAYSGTNFTGSQINMYTCRTYNIPWSGDGSWDNNQSSGTRAKMYNSSGSLIYTTPGARSYDKVGSWTPVYKVRNC